MYDIPAKVFGDVTTCKLMPIAENTIRRANTKRKTVIARNIGTLVTCMGRSIGNQLS
jgi:hypothetical protein